MYITEGMSGYSTQHHAEFTVRPEKNATKFWRNPVIEYILKLQDDTLTVHGRAGCPEQHVETRSTIQNPSQASSYVGLQRLMQCRDGGPNHVLRM